MKYTRQSDTGTVFTSWAMPLMNEGWFTSSRCTGAPMPSKNASQSKPGASFWYSGNDIGL